MKLNRKNLARTAVLLLAAFAGLNLLAWRHARAMLIYRDGGDRTPPPEALTWPQKLRVVLWEGVRLPRPESSLEPSALHPSATEVRIPVSPEITLGAWEVSQGRDRPLVILFHGYGAEKTGLLPEARAFLELGTSVLLVDFRGSGASSSGYTTLGVHEAEDVEAAVTYAREHLPHTGLVLYGSSMGAAAILRAVHEGRADPDAVILAAVFDTMLDTVRNRFRSMRLPPFPGAELLVFWSGLVVGESGFRHNPADFAASLTCPALFLHGTEDPRATVADGRRVYRAAAGPRRFVEFAGGHESALLADPDLWRREVAALLEAAH